MCITYDISILFKTLSVSMIVFFIKCFFFLETLFWIRKMLRFSKSKYTSNDRSVKSDVYRLKIFSIAFLKISTISLVMA